MADSQYPLAGGDYSLNFLRGLAMVAHLKLVTPSELAAWQKAGMSPDRLTAIFFNRLMLYRTHKG